MSNIEYQTKSHIESFECRISNQIQHSNRMSNIEYQTKSNIQIECRISNIKLNLTFKVLNVEYRTSNIKPIFDWFLIQLRDKWILYELTKLWSVSVSKMKYWWAKWVGWLRAIVTVYWPRPDHFGFKGCRVVFFNFIQILIEYAVSKQWGPWSQNGWSGSALFAYVSQTGH